MSDHPCCPDCGSRQVRAADSRCPLRDVGLLDASVRYRCQECSSLFLQPAEVVRPVHAIVGVASMVLVMGLAVVLAVLPAM